MLSVAWNTDAIVTSSLTRPLCTALSQKLEVPLCIVNLQPWAPTDNFPHFSNTDEFVEVILKNKRSNNVTGISRRKEYADSYGELEKYHHEFLCKRLDQIVHSNLNLPQVSFDHDARELLCGRNDKTLIINAFLSPEMIPCCSDNGPNVFDIGPLADAYIPEGWEVPNELLTFLENSEARIWFDAI